ncbi:MAG: SDR family NAD(P)-dependent oxidoreductase [Candidatus Freyarchaeota archaeon]
MKKEYVLERMDGQEVLVTGGLGFVGSNLAHRLVELGARVTIYDALLKPYGGNMANIKEIQDKVEVVIGDVRDFDKLKNYVKDKDIIFNNAAQSSHLISMEDPLLDIDINCRGIMNVLEACRKYNDSAKIVYSGSRGQLGKLEYSPADERHPENPLDIYGVNKVAGEKYHLVYHRIYGMRTTSIRMNNGYGPRAQIKHPKFCILNWFIRQALLNEVITVYGDGKQTRDYNYIDDMVDALILAAQSSKADGEVFLLGSGKEIPIIDLIKLIIKIVGQGEYKHVPWPKESKAIEIGNFFVSYEKIHKTLGWHPVTPIEEGLRKTVEFYKERLEEYV